MVSLLCYVSCQNKISKTIDVPKFYHMFSLYTRNSSKFYLYELKFKIYSTFVYSLT